MIQNILVQEPIQAAIWHCLNHYAYMDAIFLAERLLAEVDSEEALHLLATSYYRSGKPGRAYTLLQRHGHNTPELKYLMAKCCYDLGKLDEAEVVLTGGSVLKPKQVEEVVNDYGPIACFALELLGIICTKTERMGRATEVLRRALKLNPFMWHSFATLCDNGDKPDPAKVFKLDSLENLSNVHGNTVCSIINGPDSNHPMTNSDTHISGNMLSNVSLNTPVNEIVLHQVNHTQLTNTQQQPLLNPHNNSQNHSNIPVITAPMQPNSMISTPIQPSLTSIITPITMNVVPIPDSLENDNVSKVKKFVRFKRLSPISPRFGILPLDFSHSGESEVSSISSSLAFLTPSPNAFSPIDPQSNKKYLGGKGIICRNTGKDAPLVMNKPTVLSPGNNSNFQSPPTGQALVRRSSRLFGNSNSVKENNKNRFVAPKSPARKAKTRSSKNQNSLSELNEKNRSENHEIISSSEKPLSEKIITPQNLLHQALNIQKHSAEGLMSLFREIGNAYLHLSQYNCRKAIDLFVALPSQHYNTAWVLAHLAKAYYEMNDFNQAIKYFSEVREKDSHSLHLMEYYSSSLWQLQKEVHLSALAQDLVEVDRDSPQSWCATGNCFALQKEHEAAIKFFSRAIQADPNFAYAYTLLGHEHLATEELDRALSCYRSAVRIDPRHYNAWYGIGLVLFKQERFSQAEWYFKKAVAIHPHSSILLCHVAVVEHTLQKSNAALITLNRALNIDPSNPLCKYNRASILHSLDRNQEALDELIQLKEIVPKEANVYYLLGKVYKRLGETHLALMNFSWAMDLDPKGANNQFKEAIDPSINGFPLDEEENGNNNPQENVPSDSSVSLAAAEISQESLILEPTIDNAQMTGNEDQPLSASSGSSLTQSSSSNPLLDVHIVTTCSRISLSNEPNSTVSVPGNNSGILVAGNASSLQTPSSNTSISSSIAVSNTISIAGSSSLIHMYSSTSNVSLLNSSLPSTGPSSNLQVSSTFSRPCVRFSDQRVILRPPLPVFNINDDTSVDDVSILDTQDQEQNANQENPQEDIL